MEYKDEIKKGISRIPQAKLRKAVEPLISQLRTDLLKAIEVNKSSINKDSIDNLTSIVLNGVTKSLAISEASRPVITQEDIHRVVDESVDKFAKSLPTPEAIDITTITKPILKAVGDIAKAAEAPINMLDYRPHDQDTNNEVFKFYGFVAADGSWYIVRDDTKEKQQRYAAGTSDYKAAWLKRAGKLKYGYIDEVL
jgi:hypothetical protein